MATAPNSRPSTSSDSLESGRSSPVEGFDSSAALILVPDTEDAAVSGASTPFDFSSDDDSDDEASGQAERLQASAIPPLSSLSVFMYLLAPYLKLGTFLLPDGHLPLRIAIPALLVFAVLSAFTRQLWYMLARYVRRTDLEEIVLETFARERAKEGRRWFLRQLVRLFSGLFRILLSAMYLRVSADAVLLFITGNPQVFYLVPPVVLALVIAPIYFAPSLARNRVIYASWFSVIAYIAWFICTAIMQSHGAWNPSPASNQSLGTLWQGVSNIAIAFTTSSTIPLYSSLRGTVHPLATRPRRSQSFKLLSAVSVGIAVMCTLPLVFWQRTYKPEEPSAETLHVVAAVSNIVALVFSIPSILIPTPALPIPRLIRRSIPLPLSKVLVYIITVGLALLPQDACCVLSDVVWILAFTSTYMLPALVHIAVHNFRRPLSIVIPPTTPIMPSPSSARSAEPSDSHNDELLQRKERTLQRRSLRRRIIWDIAVWVLLLPVGGGGLVWAAGTIAGRW